VSVRVRCLVSACAHIKLWHMRSWRMGLWLCGPARKRIGHAIRPHNGFAKCGPGATASELSTLSMRRRGRQTRVPSETAHAAPASAQDWLPPCAGDVEPKAEQQMQRQVVDRVVGGGACPVCALHVCHSSRVEPLLSR